MFQTYQETLKKHKNRVPGGAFEAVAKEMQITPLAVKAVFEAMRPSKTSTAKTKDDDQKSVYEAVCKLQEEKCKEEKIFEKVAKNLGITNFKARDFYSNALNDLATKVCNLNYVC